jgi:hypothetical protein
VDILVHKQFMVVMAVVVQPLAGAVAQVVVVGHSQLQALVVLVADVVVTQVAVPQVVVAQLMVVAVEVAVPVHMVAVEVAVEQYLLPLLTLMLVVVAVAVAILAVVEVAVALMDQVAVEDQVIPILPMYLAQHYSQGLEATLIAEHQLAAEQMVVQAAPEELR